MTLCLKGSADKDKNIVKLEQNFFEIHSDYCGTKDSLNALEIVRNSLQIELYQARDRFNRLCLIVC